MISQENLDDDPFTQCNVIVIVVVFFFVSYQGDKGNQNSCVLWAFPGSSGKLKKSTNICYLLLLPASLCETCC